MTPDPKPFIRVEQTVSIEIEYDPFKGKTAEQVAETLQDDLSDLLMDARPDILSLSTSIVEIHENTQY